MQTRLISHTGAESAYIFSLPILPLANPAFKRALKYQIREYVWICTGIQMTA